MHSLSGALSIPSGERPRRAHTLRINGNDALYRSRTVPLYLERQVSLPYWSTLGLAERCHDCQKITSFCEARPFREVRERNG